MQFSLESFYGEALSGVAALGQRGPGFTERMLRFEEVRTQWRARGLPSLNITVFSLDLAPMRLWVLRLQAYFGVQSGLGVFHACQVSRRLFEATTAGMQYGTNS